MQTIDTLKNVLNRPVLRINWRTSKVNIIYIPMGEASFIEFFKSNNQFTIMYKYIVVPNKIAIAGMPVISTTYVRNYKESIKTAQFLNSVKKTVKTPAMVDMSPVVDVIAKKLKGSGGTLRVVDEFYKLLSSIYASLDHSFDTIIVYDNSKGYIEDVKRLLMYFKYNQYKLPYKVVDTYGLMYLGNNIGFYTVHTAEAVLRPNTLKLEKFVSSISDKRLSEEQSADMLDTTVMDSTVTYNIKRDDVEKALKLKYKKEVSSDTVNTIYNLWFKSIKSI